MKLDPKHLKACLLAAGKDITRDNLCGINVNFDRKRICATDGHRAHLIDEIGPVEFTGDVTIPRATVEFALKMKDTELTCVDNVWKLGQLTFEPLRAFPPIEQVIPKADAPATEPVAFNAKYVADGGKAMDILFDHSHICLKYHGRTEPMTCRFLNFTFLVMPVQM